MPNYNTYTPMYQPYSYQPYQYQAPVMQQTPMQTPVPQAVQTQPMQQPVQQTQTIQNGGFVSVPNEATARNWPVAPGNSVTFKDENAPYCYIKTMSFNQFETPQFVKYRLVREDAVIEPTSDANQEVVPVPEYALKTDVDAISAVIDEVKGDIAEFRTELFGLAGKKKSKKEDTDNA